MEEIVHRLLLMEEIKEIEEKIVQYYF